MDDLDHRLIALLRTDARQPVSSLAAALGVSRATVKARIDRLTETGLIQGFTVVLKTGMDANRIRAITLVEVEGKTAESVIRRLHGFPEVRAINTTNGRWDIVAEIEVDTLDAFDRTLQRLRQIDGIAATETSLLLSARK